MSRFVWISSPVDAANRYLVSTVTQSNCRKFYSFFSSYYYSSRLHVVALMSDPTNLKHYEIHSPVNQKLAQGEKITEANTTRFALFSFVALFISVGEHTVLVASPILSRETFTNEKNANFVDDLSCSNDAQKLRLPWTCHTISQATIKTRFFN